MIAAAQQPSGNRALGAMLWQTQLAAVDLRRA
jgi:hypothetical protein